MELNDDLSSETIDLIRFLSISGNKKAFRAGRKAFRLLLFF